MALPLSDIRQLAEAAECWEEVSFNERSRVISFEHVDGCSRVNVYYTTGTIGTAIDHPVMGKTQLFRRNVTRNDLDRIFANPRAHTGKGYYEIKKRKLGGSSVWVSPSSSPPSAYVQSVHVPDETEALKTHVKYLLAEVEATKGVIASIEAEGRRAEASRLERERQEAAKYARMQREEEQERARAVEKQRRHARIQQEEEEEREERARVVRRNRKRGEHSDYVLTNSTHMPQSMDDVKCVAIGEGGYVAVHDSGSACYHGIPTELLTDIKRAGNSNLSIISIGPKYYDYDAQDYKSQYYLLKTNGKVFFNENPTFREAHYENPATPKFVSFGPHGTYYIKFEGGSTAWGGDISDSVRRIFKDAMTNVVCVWLGADENSYFVGYEENGDYKKSYKNLPHKMMQKYASNRNYEVRQMLCDTETGNCFIRYNY